jgi:hypothetical protein
MCSPRIPGAGIAGAQISLGGDVAASATVRPFWQKTSQPAVLPHCTAICCGHEITDDGPRQCSRRRTTQSCRPRNRQELVGKVSADTCADQIGRQRR